MKFRLAAIAYAFALLAAGMAAFGAIGGVMLATAILLAWQFTYEGRQAFGVVLLGGVGLLVVVMLYPALVPLASARNAMRRNDCVSNLKQICLALSHYESANGAFPPPFIADADGKPMHSWRVLLLPYMEQQALYDEYDFDEPWDGPNNRKLWDRIPYFYSCTSCERCREIGGRPFGELPRNASNYVAIVGDRTAWPVGKQVKRSDLSDDTSETLQVLEYSGMKVPWTAPVDLTYEDAIEVLTGDDSQGHLRIDESLAVAKFTRDFRMGGFCDAHAKLLGSGLTDEYARAFLTIAGGEAIESNAAPYYRDDVAPPTVTVIRYERVYALTAFALLALWPGAAMWRRGRSGPPV